MSLAVLHCHGVRIACVAERDAVETTGVTLEAGKIVPLDPKTSPQIQIRGFAHVSPCVQGYETVGLVAVVSS